MKAHYWDILSKTYAYSQWLKSAVARSDYSLTKSILLEYLEPKENDVILEVGCGPGVWTKLIAEKCKKLIAIDISKDMLKRAKRYVNRKNVKFLLSDSFSQTDFKFDKIFAVRSFEYIKDKAAAIERFNNLLRDNGKLVVVTKSKPCFWDFVYMQKWKKEKFCQEKVSYRVLRRLFSQFFDDVTLKPAIIRLPIFTEGNDELPLVPKPLQKYFLNIFGRVTKISRKFPDNLMPIALIVSESYLACGTKKCL
ncbi:MAG: class I SAM-dependent methyltransferase [Candidatus Aenigmarchaeota archaeon]|nr:class I SAM-dependent methyltransferase [Candidatus Aenigmarchaeota archaeon]